MIPHNKPSIGIEESRAMAEVIASGWVAPGEKVKQFEQIFADFVGVKYAVAVNSGTAALFITLKILSMGKGNRVLLPTYACTALLNAIYAAGAKPVLHDINKNDFNIRKIEFLDGIADALVNVHTFGVPQKIERKYKYPLIIEDCSQALGSYIDGQHVGLQGDIGIFSFGPSKMITTGSGGMIVTNNKNLAEKAKNFIDYDCRGDYQLRFNFAMNDIQAAMGIEQMKKLLGFLKNRMGMANVYQNICWDKGWQIQGVDWDGRNNYRFVIIGDFIERLKRYLADNGITAITPIEQWELLHNYLGLPEENYSNALWVAKHTLSLPIYPDLLDAGFNKILEVLRRF